MRIGISALCCSLLACAQEATLTTEEVPPAIPRTCRPVPAPMRALTARQYDRVVADLLGDTTQPARVLERPASDTRFDNHAEWVGMDEVRLRFYLGTAESLANAAMTRQATLFPCSAPAAAQ